MGLFNKHTLNELMVLQFSKKDAEMFRKNKVMQQLIQKVGHDNRTEINTINSELPLMTFSVANALFKLIQKEIGTRGEYVAFEPIDILYRENKGRSFKYIPYLQVKDFGIDIKYKDFTGAVFENIFNGEEFEDIDTETKRNWAREFLDEYVMANPEQKVLAILPTEEEAEGNYEAKYEGLDDFGELGNEKNVSNPIPTTGSITEVENTSGNNSPNKTIKNKPGILNKLPEKKETNTNESTDKDAQVSSGIPASEAKELKATKLDLPVDVHKGTIKVPRFEVTEIPKVSVAEKGYVAYKVNEKRKATNKYLQTLEQQINFKNSEYLTKLRQQLQENIDQQIEDFISENDPKKGLHEEIKSRLLKQKEIEETKILKRMKDKCDEDVEAIKRQADIDIEARKNRYKTEVAKRKDEISDEFAKKATNEEANELQKRKDTVTQKLDKFKNSLVIKALATFNAEASDIASNGNKTGGTVFKKLANMMEDWEQDVNKEHLNAVELQASADRAKFNLEDMRVLNENIRKLKAEKADAVSQKEKVVKENTSLEKKVAELRKQVSEAKKESTSDEFFKEFLKAQLVQQNKNNMVAVNGENQSSMPVNNSKTEDSSKKKEIFSKPLMVSAAVLATLGIGSVGMHEVHMDQKYDAAVQAINKKESSNEAFKAQLQKTQSDMEALKTKNSSIKNENDKLQSRLDKSKKEAEKVDKNTSLKVPTKSTERYEVANSVSTSKENTFSSTSTSGSEN